MEKIKYNLFLLLLLTLCSEKVFSVAPPSSSSGSSSTPAPALYKNNLVNAYGLIYDNYNKAMKHASIHPVVINKNDTDQSPTNQQLANKTQLPDLELLSSDARQ